jgi:DeoR family transcriptional regulator, glycerol-3-phosphate regulon repressor
MRPSDRRDLIVSMVRERERVTVDFLAQELTASCETIRRDLTELAARGVIRKFHGGAALPDAGTSAAKIEGSFQSRMTKQMREKRAIAKRAATLFSPGDTLFIDTGTTTVVFAEELARLSRLTVITNSVLIVQAIARGARGNRAFLIGGEYKDGAGENLGTLAVEQIGRFRATHAVLTVGAVEADGVTDYDLDEAQIALAMIGQARHLTVLADASKLGRNGLFQVCAWEDVDRLVIDQAPEGAVAKALHSADVEVIVAPASGAGVA